MGEGIANGEERLKPAQEKGGRVKRGEVVERQKREEIGRLDPVFSQRARVQGMTTGRRLPRARKVGWKEKKREGGCGDGTA